jgi:trk system potassium uptake protein
LARHDVVVIGLGRFGAALALRLEDEGRHVLGVDVDERVVASLAEELRDLAIAEARDEETLRQLGVGAETLVVLGMTNVAASLMTATALNELGVREVWAKAGSRQHVEALRRLGVARIIQPEREAGLSMAEEILRR